MKRLIQNAILGILALAALAGSQTQTDNRNSHGTTVPVKEKSQKDPDAPIVALKSEQLRENRATGKCSVRLLEIPAANIDSAMALPLPKSRDKMPIVKLPAPPCPKSNQ